MSGRESDGRKGPLRIVVKGAAGRLGQMLLAQIAEARDLTLHSALVSPRSTSIGQSLPFGLSGCYETTLNTIESSDVLIDVSTDPQVDPLLALCRQHGMALLSGNTQLAAGAIDRMRDASTDIAVLYTANFSVGIAVLQQLLAQARVQLGSDFQLGIFDLHHQHKRDAPSGTALALEQAAGTTAQHANLRLGEIFGEHRAFLVSRDERIELAHCALNRSVFASGALRAARFLVDALPGFYGMHDVIKASPNESLS